MLAAVKQQGLHTAEQQSHNVILYKSHGRSSELKLKAESAAACNGCITAGEGPAARGHADQR